MHRSGRGRGGGAGQGHDLLDRQPQLQQVQRVADADLTLDLRVQQGRHDDAALHVGSQAATYQAGIPTQNWDGRQEARGYAWLWRD